MGAVAAVCRDFHGNYMGASTITFVGIFDPTTLDALVVREAQALADDLYERRIYIASYCKAVINDIKQRSAASHGAIIQEIIDRSSLFTSCFFSHEY